MATQRNGRGRKPVDRKPRKSYYVPVAQRRAAQKELETLRTHDGDPRTDPRAAQREFAFGAPNYMAQGEVADAVAVAINADREKRMNAAFSALGNLDEDQRQYVLDAISPQLLLESLARRGGTLKACADAQLLCIRKADDYRNGSGHKIDAGLDAYFPFGLVSHTQMLHTKTQRLISLARKQGVTNFESVRDTALDIINYASFLAEWLERTQGEGQ